MTAWECEVDEIRATYWHRSWVIERRGREDDRAHAEEVVETLWAEVARLRREVALLRAGSGLLAVGLGACVVAP